MRVRTGLPLFSAAFLLASDSTSMGVSAQTYNALEYKFNNVVNRIVENTGIGDPSPSSSLNGILFPATGNRISFPADNVAKFRGDGCIVVPDSVDVNEGDLNYRMISLRFKWNGGMTSNDAQVLYEEGDDDAGLNIYLDRLRSGGTARLFMAAWEHNDETANSLQANVVRTGRTAINEDQWYEATMVLDADAGTLSGYLDNDLFDEKDVNFFPIRSRQGGNCLGGTKSGTLIFPQDPDAYSPSNTYYFKGEIRNFRIRNERPIDSTPAVEYTFSRKNNRYKNTGTGSDLDGILTPESSNGITAEGSIGAKFTGKGCIQVPDSNDVNTAPVSDRTIMLDFQWDKTVADDNAPQMLFEEGGYGSGINIYLDSFDRNNADLIMAVWEESGKDSAFVNTAIKANAWYQLSLVLDRFGTSPNGILTGYLDGVRFGEADIDFFAIDSHSLRNCLGGMRQPSRIFSTDGSGASTQTESAHGLYFNGLIDNFRLFNEVVRPVVPTASPSEAPTTAPTMAPVLVVKYTFDNSTTENTGDGDPSPFSSLDGILFPEEGNEIDFLLDAGNVVARFGGAGCIQVPSGRVINNNVQDRTIALDFMWDGTLSNDIQVLFEEGGGGRGINIYLRAQQEGTADLIMGVWKTTLQTVSSEFVSTTIYADTWYQTSLVLDHINGANGTLAGYVGGIQFEEQVVDFGGIRHSQDNCLGGKKSQTRIMGSSDGSPGDGFYFHGRIDNFQLFNSVEIPTDEPSPARSWVNITYDDFESGLGSFDLSDDAERFEQQNRAHQGFVSVRIKYSLGTNASSIFHANDHAMSMFSNLRVSFWYYAMNMADNDGFLLEYSPDSGDSWETLKVFRGKDFEDRNFTHGLVDTDMIEMTNGLTDSARIRFRCFFSELSGFRAIFIDEVLVQGKVALTEPPTEEPTASPTKTLTFSSGISVGSAPGIAVGSSSDIAVVSSPGITVRTEEPTASPTKMPTDEPTATPTKTRTNEPTASPTKKPTKEPTASPTKMPTEEPTASPTEMPTKQPTASPTKKPTEEPTASPTKMPTEEPTASPTKMPTKQPTASPTKKPTAEPKASPTKIPTEQPTASPTKKPTEEPTASPTKMPTEQPTEPPMEEPTAPPTESPTKEPTESPTKEPTASPTKTPTEEEPTASPTEPPTEEPMASPTKSPTAPPMQALTAPSAAPSEQPTPLWNNITYDNFEAGWGNFQPSSFFAVLTRTTSPDDSLYIPQGTAAVRLSRNWWSTPVSFRHTENQDVGEYSNLRVQFSYYLRGLEEGDGFILEYSSNGGTAWTTIKQFEFGNDIQNGFVLASTVEFNAPTNQARLRFRCNLNAFSKYVYIDEVAFQGYVP